ncbi:MAG: MoxR family ATPase [Deltaproteobacteria bacterium]|nr:MoxR family ATPase [Deltaproteobacteria bacterium]
MSAAEDLALFDDISALRQRFTEAVGRVIVGQTEAVELLLITLLSDGHCLFVGVPGLAKTLLVRTAALALGLKTDRVQFTPDLMPSDILGTELIEEDHATGRRVRRFIEGPVFTHLLLADEINRTPPKTQAALLQAMQERAVTVTGATRFLEPPFVVLATQNPIEQEGTYPLPEAQLDRFMFSIRMDYPSDVEEVEVVRRTTTGDPPNVTPVVARDTLLQQQALVRRLPTSDDVLRYAVRLARATRPFPGSPEGVRQWVQWGAGPRASQYLALGARVRAALHGHEVPHLEDVRALAPVVLGHRLVLNFEAEASGVTTEQVVARLLEEVPAR